MVPTGYSPGPSYVSYSSCQVESDGSIGSYGTVVGDSYGNILFQENFSFRSPHFDYDGIACHVVLDGDIRSAPWNVDGNSYGRKYFVTLRLPTQLETVYFMLKLMEEVI